MKYIYIWMVEKQIIETEILQNYKDCKFAWIIDTSQLRFKCL